MINRIDLIKEKSLKKLDINKTGKRKYMSKKAISLIMLLISSLSLCACNQKNEMLKEENIDYSVSDIIIDNTLNVNEEMEKSGIIYSENLTVEDYKKIENLDEDDLFSYYNSLGKVECEKVVIALGYDGWDDFLKQKNFDTIRNWVAYETSKIINNGKMR